jgi:PhnB protein
MRIGDSMVFVSDGDFTGEMRFGGFSLSLSATSEADADQLFSALSEGGQVTMPLCKTFFAARFGMLSDRFALGWMVVVEN